MFKDLGKGVSEIVKVQSKLVGRGTNAVLTTVGYEQTGNFIEEQIIDFGEEKGNDIEVTATLFDAAGKSVVGMVKNDSLLKENGATDFDEAKNQWMSSKVTHYGQKLDGAKKVADGLYTGNLRQIKDGATGIIGLKKSAIAANALSDLISKTNNKKLYTYF